MTLSLFFHVLFRRGAVSLRSLIDFNKRLLSSHFEDNLGHLGRGSSVTDLFFLYFLIMSVIVLFGIFNCIDIALDGNLSWCKAIICPVWNSLVGFPLGMLWSAIY